MKRMILAFAATSMLAAAAAFASQSIVVWGPNWVYPVWNLITQTSPTLRQFQSQPYCAEILMDPDTLEMTMIDLPDEDCGGPVPEPVRKAKPGK